MIPYLKLIQVALLAGKQKSRLDNAKVEPDCKEQKARKNLVFQTSPKFNRERGPALMLEILLINDLTILPYPADDLVP